MLYKVDKVPIFVPDYKWLRVTPGEEAHFNPLYDTLCQTFAKMNDITYQGKFIKVRLVRSKGQYDITGAWWKGYQWMDETFWCFQTPVPLYHSADQKTPYLCYALEPYECKRVDDDWKARWGHSKWGPSDSLIIPCDCCEQCWDETSAGVSDHVKERAKVDDVKDPLDQEVHLSTENKLLNLKSAKEKEAEIELEEKAAQIEKQIEDITEDPKWDKEVKLSGGEL